MVMKLSDEFTATDPVTTFDIKVQRAKTGDGFWVYEYGASSPRFLMADTVRALIQYGRYLERAELEESLRVESKEPLKAEMIASQKNGLLCFDIGGLQIAMDGEQARAVKGVIDSWLAGDSSGWASEEAIEGKFATESINSNELILELLTEVQRLRSLLGAKSS